MNYKNIKIKVFAYGTILANSNKLKDDNIHIISEYPKIFYPKIIFNLKDIKIKYNLIMYEKIFKFPKDPEIWIKEILINQFKEEPFLYIDDSPQYIRSVSNISNSYICNFKTYELIN